MCKTKFHNPRHGHVVADGWRRGSALGKRGEGTKELKDERKVAYSKVQTTSSSLIWAYRCARNLLFSRPVSQSSRCWITLTHFTWIYVYTMCMDYIPAFIVCILNLFTCVLFPSPAYVLLAFRLHVLFLRLCLKVHFSIPAEWSLFLVNILYPRCNLFALTCSIKCFGAASCGLQCMHGENFVVKC